MGYAGSFNGFTFGDGVAAVSSLDGWRRSLADIQVMDGMLWNSSGSPRFPSLTVTLGLGFITETADELDDMIDQAMRRFSASAGVLPLTIDDRTRWAQVVSIDPKRQPDWPGPERTTVCPVQFVCTDPVLYGATPHVQTWASPVSTSSFQMANAGWEIPYARRAWDLRLEAVGTVQNPKIKVSHPDGSYEQVIFNLSMSDGQVLTLGADGVPRVGSRIANRCTSTNQTGLTSPARLPWRLIDSTGSDSRNAVTVSVQTGQFTGTLKSRDTRL